MRNVATAELLSVEISTIERGGAITESLNLEKEGDLGVIAAISEMAHSVRSDKVFAVGHNRGRTD